MKPLAMLNTYDVVDTWQRMLALPSARWASMARVLDDRVFEPTPLAWLEGMGLADDVLRVRRAQSAGFRLLGRLTEPHAKPEFGITHVAIDGHDRAVTETTVDDAPFCRLKRFDVDAREHAREVLLVAPMAGHYATLLRETVRDLLPTCRVFVTDWANARDVPLSAGGFDLDDYIEHVVRYVRLLGPQVHVVAVCQAGVPAFAAVALLEAEEATPKEAPASLAILGAPIDTSASPTQVDSLATQNGIDWFTDTLISTVPARYPGAFRAVYPGYLQLTAFLAMNPRRHEKSWTDGVRHFADGDFAFADKIDSFYGEFLSTMDLTAEFYLQTVAKVFQGNELARGVFHVRDRLVDPGAIRNTPLLAIEAERDDITGIGQTRAALDLACRLHKAHKQYMLLEEAGHYGLFSGSRFREQVVPRLAQFQAAAVA